MLSQDDRRELEMIAHHLQIEDPKFARALAEGTPRRPAGDRRWPLVMAAAVGVGVFLVGMLIQAIVVMLPAAAAVGCVGVVYWRHVRRSQGRRGDRPRKSPP